MVEQIVKITEELVNIDSPTGYKNDIVKYLRQYLTNFDVEIFSDKKGNLYCEIDKGFDTTTLIATHVDTLGLMVKSINENGTLNVDSLGGINVSTLNGAYCKIRSRDGKIYTGVIHNMCGSTHVSKSATDKLEINNIVVSIDEKINNKDDIKSLKIDTGCFVFVEPKFSFTNNFIKSRFLDDKLCVATSLVLIEQIIANNIDIKQNLIFAFSTYEEVGHGMAHVVKNIDNFIALDMACVGDGLDGNEYKVTVCPKDSSGPYDFDLVNRFIELCDTNELDYAVDIYPFYGSDGSAALRGGNDIRVALIGPGVANSHGVERSHIDGVLNTYKLLVSFITSKFD